MRYNIVVGLLIGILAFFQYRLWFEPGGMRDLRQLKANLAQRIQENEQLKQQNDELLAQIKNLKNSKDAAESRARNELGMIKKDEMFYQIVK